MPINFKAVLEIAHQAGACIMDIYQKDFATYTKADESPLTDADLAVHTWKASRWYHCTFQLRPRLLSVTAAL